MPLTLAEQVDRVEQAQEETRKFVAERDRLTAEGLRLDRDRSLAPVVVLASMAAGAASFAAGTVFMRAWGTF